MSEEGDEKGYPFWTILVVAAIMGLSLGQCTFITREVIEISGDQFALKLKIDRIERKIDDVMEEIK